MIYSIELDKDYKALRETDWEMEDFDKNVLALVLFPIV